MPAPPLFPKKGFAPPAPLGIIIYILLIPRGKEKNDVGCPCRQTVQPCEQVPRSFLPPGKDKARQRSSQCHSQAPATAKGIRARLLEATRGAPPVAEGTKVSSPDSRRATARQASEDRAGARDTEGGWLLENSQDAERF